MIQDANVAGRAAGISGEARRVAWPSRNTARRRSEKSLGLQVREAVLVELQDAVLRQGPSVQVLLDAVSPNASLTVLFVQRAE